MAASITLTWDPAPTATGYRLWLASGTQPFSPILTTAETSATWSFTGTNVQRFYVTATNFSGESLPSNVVTNTPVQPPTGLSFEAESGTITLPFYVTAAGVVQQDTQANTPAEGGRAAYQFTITNAGDYIVTAWVNCPNDSADSFFVNVDAEPTDLMVWDTGSTSGVQERTVQWRGDAEPPHRFTLALGQHILIFRGREPGALLDRIVFSPVSVTPTPPPVPPAPTNLRFSFPTGSRLDIGWTTGPTYSTRIERSLNGSGFSTLAVVSPGTLHYSSTLKKQDTATFRLKACEPNPPLGLCSDYSQLMTVSR